MLVLISVLRNAYVVLLHLSQNDQFSSMIMRICHLVAACAVLVRVALRNAPNDRNFKLT